MAAVYSNPLNLFNITVKSTPTTSDLLPIGDAAVTGVPLKQVTIGSLPFAPAGGNVVSFTTSTEAMAINTRYYVNYTGGAATLTLPLAASSPLGTFVEIRGGEANTAGYIIALNTSQQIRCFGNVTTVTSGTITMPGAFDSIRIECDATSGGLTWTVTSINASGSIEVQ